uniref:Kinesin motor domain-containing protein n=1 Tax=Alexandrium monilatum TaxID=311494 RepID=A0A7S4QWX0_9DINO
MPGAPRTSEESAGGTRPRSSTIMSAGSTGQPATGPARLRAMTGSWTSGGNIKVCVRVRPFNRRELASNESRCVHVRSRSEVALTDVLEAEKSFSFDRAYDSSIEPTHVDFASQETLMADLGVEVKENSLGGYNSCLFAYGQTGSGKTFSVLGSPDLPGLLPRVVSQVFDELSAGGEGMGTYSCSVAYLEIYMEALRDLLAPPGDTTKLEVRNSPQVGVYIQNLKETPVFTKHDVSQLLEFGAKNRMVAATCMNDQSSRSHCIFTLEIRRKIPGQDGQPPQLLRSKLNLVDLAGSERQKRTQAAGGTLKEGAAINQSLSHLANVIFKLAELAEKKGKSNSDFVPFRNSKLTMALMDSLGGNSKTIMIAALSPAEVNYDETLSTLRFAKRVKVVKTSAKQNAESEGSLVARLKAECEQLKAQIAQGQADRVAHEHLQDMEALVDKYGQDLEGQLVLARQMQDKRNDALKDLGLSSKSIGESLGLDESTPQLVNISNDPSLVGCLVYFLTQGDPIAVGSTKGCKIQLHGLGMKPTMAVIHNTDNLNISIEANEGRVLVNGQLVRGEQPLKHCDRLILGHAHCFRVMIPLAAIQDEARHVQQTHDLEVALAEVVPSNSDSYEKCKFFVRELQDRIGQQKAQKFLAEFGKVLTEVEEANAITTEVRPCEHLRFCAEVLTDLFLYQQEEPEVVVRLKRVETGRARLRTLMRKSRMTRVSTDDGEFVTKKPPLPDFEEETYETVAVLDVPSFQRRLVKLRAIYGDWAAEKGSSSGSEEEELGEGAGDDPLGEVNEEEETRRAERCASSARVSVVDSELIQLGRHKQETPARAPAKRTSARVGPSQEVPARQGITGSSPARSSKAGRRSQRSPAEQGAAAVASSQRPSTSGKHASQAVNEEHASDHIRWTQELQEQIRRIEETRAEHREAQEVLRQEVEAERRGWEEQCKSQEARIAQLEQAVLQAEAKDVRIAKLEAQLRGEGVSRPLTSHRTPATAQKLKKDGRELVEAARLASQLAKGLQGMRQGLLADQNLSPRGRNARLLERTA